MAKAQKTRDNHEVLTLCYSCVGTTYQTPPGTGPEKCRRCKGTGYEK